MLSWGQRVNFFFRDHPVPWGIDDSKKKKDCGCNDFEQGLSQIVDVEGKTVFKISGSDDDINLLVQYINFQAGRGH